MLRDHGIDAFVFASSASGIGIPFCSGTLGVPLQVKADDVEEARRVLASNKRDSIDIDWDELELAGQENPNRAPATMRLPAKIAFAVTAIVLLSGLLISLVFSIIQFAN
ncbi:MAG TPA: hypothetical protein EYO31_08440 [Phycisphaerales bacterium]|nr:hypothetical protein [Phycisphaerales bacterium]